MKGMTATRSQTDNNFDQISDDNVLDCSAEPDNTRQEDKKFTDINYQLKMFGQDPFGAREPQFGAEDYRLDLQSAIQATTDAKTAFKRLPAALRKKYPTWVALLTAAEQGELRDLDLTTGEKKKLDKPTEEVNITPAAKP